MTQNEKKLEIVLDSQEEAKLIFGSHDKNISILEENYEVEIRSRGEVIQISGEEEDVNSVYAILKQLKILFGRGIVLGMPDVISAIKMEKNKTLNEFLPLFEEEILKDRNLKPIRIKTVGQKNYVDAIRHRDVVFGIGPAGTGKTFIAVVMAIAALKRGEVQKIIITRPAVEAGESLGFLPGDLKEKVDPYLRPIYDSFYTIYGVEHTNRLLERGIIEIAPLAYMRGRTLDDSFVILDEAQNTTVAQMKMFLTRLGYHSKMIVNGDPTQIDLPKGVMSGLIHAERTLSAIKKIAFVTFDSTDVVRHPIVAEIIKAYETSDISR